MKRKFEHPAGSKRRLAGPKVITYCDFGVPNRKTEIGRHVTFASAMRQYARLWDIYARRWHHRVWQEAP